MSGMLMSMRTTSGWSVPACSIASLPDAATPTTSMSLSKPSSFVRWSRLWDVVDDEDSDRSAMVLAISGCGWIETAVSVVDMEVAI
jgi:hypothetical protein